MILRFAPSPTGSIHIGNLRTAIFNWLYSRKNNGKFILRIEDTDIDRNSQEAIDLIMKSLQWLKINWDEKIIQSNNITRHQEVVNQLLKMGKAYKCSCSKERIDQLKQIARNNKLPRTYDGHCRNKNINSNEYVVRLKIERSKDISFHDQVYGFLKRNNNEIDDFIIQRSNGMPVYMFSAVVDDHDEEITHVMRGADHTANTFAQIEIYNMFNWQVPLFSHIPLILNEKGEKLSKRNGAASLNEYIEMGILPEAMINGLLRLGWSYENEEFIPIDKALQLFDINGIGKSSAQFDLDKIMKLNTLYIHRMNNSELFKRLYQYSEQNIEIMEAKDRIIAGMDGMKSRCKTLKQLLNMSKIYLYNFKPIACEFDENEKALLAKFANTITQYDNIENDVRSFCKKENIKLVKFARMIRLILTGSEVSPSIFDIISILQKEAINRIYKYI